MNTNPTNLTVTPGAASPWTAAARTREQFGIAPSAPLQGSGMSAAGAYAAKHAATTRTAVLTDVDGRVPPRGRPV